MRVPGAGRVNVPVSLKTVKTIYFMSCIFNHDFYKCFKRETCCHPRALASPDARGRAQVSELPGLGGCPLPLSLGALHHLPEAGPSVTSPGKLSLTPSPNWESSQPRNDSGGPGATQGPGVTRGRPRVRAARTHAWSPPESSKEGGQVSSAWDHLLSPRTRFPKTRGQAGCGEG